MKPLGVCGGLAAFLTAALFIEAPSLAQPTTGPQPVKVIRPLDASVRDYAELDLRVSPRYAVAGADSAYTRFDLQTGATLPLKNATFMSDDGSLGFLEISDLLALQLRKAGNPTAIYQAPPSKPGKATLISVGQRPDFVRVTPQTNRVEMIQGGFYCRWNQTSRALQRRVAIGNIGSAQTVSRDGETVICAAKSAIYRNSTRAGQKPVKVSFQGFNVSKARQILPDGSTAIYEAVAAAGGKSAPLLRIVNTKNGRELWNVKWKADASGYHDAAVFSSDETLLAIPFTVRNLWEIRATKTGALLRTLPLLSNVQAAAFSPDNATLYSAADGVLYRQSAR